MDKVHRTYKVFFKAPIMKLDPYVRTSIKLLTYVFNKQTCVPLVKPLTYAFNMYCISFIQPLTLFVELIEASLSQAGRAATELRVPFPRGDLQSKLLVGNHACLE